MFNGEHTLDQLFQNENIKADRFALAAISYIFKAFGDNIRSKEYWPWGINVNFSWDNGKDQITDDMFKDTNASSWQTIGNKSDLTRAMLCLRQAQQRSEKEETEIIKANNYRSIRDLQKRLNRISLRNRGINSSIENVNKTSIETKDLANDIIGEDL